MLQLHPASTRGRTRISWLDSAHSFSFGEFYKPDQMGFRVLRVVNDDRVAAGGGFGTHGHKDMEIISYVVSGALEHKDSIGTGSVIVPGDVQRMSAGSGIRHSEFNSSREAPVRFLQIWIPPATRGIEPSYEQRHFDEASRRGTLRLVASPDGAEGSVLIHQDARLYAGLLDGAETASLTLDKGRYAWVQVVRGVVNVNGQRMVEGDGLAVAEVEVLSLSGGEDAELLVFDLP